MILLKTDDYGNIIQRLDVPDDALLGVDIKSLGLIESNDNDVNTDTHFFLDQQFVKYNSDQLALKNNIPTYDAVWNNRLMRWVDLRSLDDIKNQTWERIKIQRDVSNTEPIEYINKMFDADLSSQAKIQGACTMAQIDSSIKLTWTLADNTDIVLDAHMILGLGVAIARRTDTNHAKARDLRLLIDEAKSVTELDAIKW